MNAAGLLAAVRPGHTLHPHQVSALDGLAAKLRGESRRAWLVLPPGAGKTLVGIEAARRLGRPIVAFGPNTAIQGQWLAEWSRLGPTPPPASADRGLKSVFTALTYQSLATFDPEAEVDPDGAQRPSHIDRLRAQGRELVAALAARPVTLILDECHHLLDVWGELLAEVLDELPDAAVIGLTATPPTALTPAESALVAKLFGEVVSGPSIPAVVREGRLAPYAELAWFTTPTDRERAWLSAQSERFGELTADLVDPAFATVGFLPWLDSYVVRRSHRAAEGSAIPWHRFARERPEIADAALRFHHAGLLALPEGARPHEAHRREPDADDWMRLLHPYARHFLGRSADLRDKHALDAVKRALPGLGYQMTAQGIRSGRSPVDRVIARSAAKTGAVRDILTAEWDVLGDRLRAVVVCDHEQARATLPSRLIGVLDEDAGSARLALRVLAGLPWAKPMLVTGRSVAAPREVAAAFSEFAARVAPDLRLDPLGDGEITAVTGSWSSRRWMPLVTRFFEEGGARVLVGTRAMLGEGWDAKGVNTLVDLTEATTGTAVVQLRGRALRLDPRWPEKVAHTWSVVCVAEDHPKGAADYERFVRKHDGYFGVTENGDVMAGVSHVDARLSPYAPPPPAAFDAFNAEMAARAADRDRTRALWRVGEPFDDRVAHAVRIVGGTRPSLSAAFPPRSVLTPSGMSKAAKSRGILVPALALAAIAMFAFGLIPAGAVFAGMALMALGIDAGRAGRAGRALHDAAVSGGDVAAMAYATAEALHRAKLIARGAEAVDLAPDEGGAWRAVLREVSTEDSALFATALDEVLSPLSDPRYLVARYVVDDPGPGPFARMRRGWPRPHRWRAEHAVVHHAVPSALADHRRRADLFARSWSRWVAETPAVYTRAPEGALLLAARRGASPMDATTALRLSWG
ncbi:DEAD/DEAH box helicase family protein [Phytomonospora sp. NPDC050363]|uniref:DEAD/DEAH box helicase family protein n=1 Tax=Phytomonospora sp. NPDC050363 TaxID=3155642 RepID=UPI0033E2D6C2